KLEKKEYTIAKPPVELKLDEFYKKYVNVNGIAVISSEKVPDSAMHAACLVIETMTKAIPVENLKSMVEHGVRVGIMARYEGTTDIPEHAYLAEKKDLNWDVRARGLGGTIETPLTTCAEENLLCYQIDKYHAEDILIHEFAHTIHNVGISALDSAFNSKLQKSLDAAIHDGKYQNTYAATNIYEYWAEGVQNWFDANAEVEHPDGKHNQVNTREEMKEYDPMLYNIIAGYFSEPTHVISCHAFEDKFHIANHSAH
ncbi:MAG: hypothetical protein MI922_01940, partial [Bacteroidales bacterium]|nr:hypothetical protein [Bacteroidales bacterium]